MKRTYKGSCHCGKVQFQVDAIWIMSEFAIAQYVVEEVR